MTPYPLAWPENIPRWKSSRQPGAFKTTLHGAMTNVSDSLRRFGADSGKPVADLVISSNVTLGANNPSDPGVAIWFKWDGLSVCIPVDRYSKVEANLQAIHHIIGARRTELRHGTLALVRATFTGFAALPSPSGKKGWRDVLGFHPSTRIDKGDVDARYRELAAERHPDKPNGSNEAMAALNAARSEALKEIAP
jgi:hypothetical protein